MEAIPLNIKKKSKKKIKEKKNTHTHTHTNKQRPLGYNSKQKQEEYASVSLMGIDHQQFAHGAMGRRIDPSWGGPIELCLTPYNRR